MDITTWDDCLGRQVSETAWVPIRFTAGTRAGEIGFQAAPPCAQEGAGLTLMVLGGRTYGAFDFSPGTQWEICPLTKSHVWTLAMHARWPGPDDGRVRIGDRIYHTGMRGDYSHGLYSPEWTGLGVWQAGREPVVPRDWQARIAREIGFSGEDTPHMPAQRGRGGEVLS